MLKRARKIRFRGNVEREGLARTLLETPGDVALVERGRPRLLVMRCPCGCGDDLLANLDRRTGPAWWFYSRHDKLSLFPSYWREDGCESHFILWNDRIFWCSFDEENDDLWSVNSSIEQAVFDALPTDRFVDYAPVADKLGFVPWEVLQACRQLESQGRAASKRKRHSFRFRRQ